MWKLTLGYCLKWGEKGRGEKASVKRQSYQGAHDCFYDGAADGRELWIGLLWQPNRERKERSEIFENEIIQHVNYTDISTMFFLWEVLLTFEKQGPVPWS